jgi:uncharacterized membrane protein
MKKKQLIGMIAMGLVAILLAFLIEIFVFNLDYFTHGGKQQDITDIATKNLELEENGRYKIMDDEASIQLKNINDYVSELEFNTKFFDKNVDIQISYNDKVIDDNIALIDKKSINIGENVDNITISLLNAKDREIYIEDFQSVNHLQINPFRVMMLLLLMMLIAVIAFTIFKKGKVQLEIIFLIFVLCFGFANTVMIPVLYGWDDAEHFVKAYNLAEGNIIMKDGEVVSYPVGMGDFLFKKYDTAYPNYRSYEEFEEETESLLKLDYSNSELAYYPSTAMTYTAVPYLFSALGILISQLLHGPFILSYYFGRFFNLLMYAITVFFAIKMIPMGKKLMFVCALLATVLFQVTSFSADVVTVGFSFLAFALIMKWLIEKKRLSVFDGLLMCGCFIMITASKVTYAPVFLLVLLLKKSNFDSPKKEWLVKLGVLFLGGITFIGVFLYGKKLGLTQWAVPGISVKDQLLFIIFNPLQYLGVLCETIVSQRNVLLGGSTVYLAYMGDLGKSAEILCWLMLLFLAFFDNEEQSGLLVMRDRSLIFLMCLVTLGISMTALYVTFTPVRNQIVLGFQGRYLIPLIFPFLFMFQKKKWLVNIKAEIINSMAIIFSGILLFYSAFYIFSLYYR